MLATTQAATDTGIRTHTHTRTHSKWQMAVLATAAGRRWHSFEGWWWVGGGAVSGKGGGSGREAGEGRGFLLLEKTTKSEKLQPAITKCHPSAKSAIVLLSSH